MKNHPRQKRLFWSACAGCAALGLLFAELSIRQHGDLDGTAPDPAFPAVKHSGPELAADEIKLIYCAVIKHIYTDGIIRRDITELIMHRETMPNGQIERYHRTAFDFFGEQWPLQPE
jgi:hypothetical protein